MAPPAGAGDALNLLARLLTVFTVAAAAMVLLSPQCTDGMFADAPMIAVASITGAPTEASHEAQPIPAMSVGPCTGVVGSAPGRCGSGTDGAVSGAGVSGAALPGEASDAVLAACVAVLSAVLLMALGLSGPRPAATGAASYRSPRWPTIFGPLTGEPRLAELCVLRT